MIKLLEKNCKFLITGATGFIGSRLCEEILKDGHKIVALTRQKNLNPRHENLKYINDLNEIDFDFDIIINLAGSPISVRWTKCAKSQIYNSRIDITKQIVEKILASKKPPRIFISGSAIGYYGTSSSIIFSENSQPTNQDLFSQKLCRDWENIANQVQTKTRVVLLRTSVVVGKNGGIIKKLLLPFKMGLGGNIGNGLQDMSWIFIDDFIRAINHIINDYSLRGGVNLVGPKATTNQQFSRELAKQLKRPCFFDMPEAMVKIIFGEMGEELLLSSQKIAPLKLTESGFDFGVVDIEEAIRKSI
jgi:hypothetical protein